MRIIVLEDEGLIAAWLCELVNMHGHSFVGPIQRTDDAFSLAASQPFDAGIIDFSLRDRPSTSFARWLDDRRIPFIWVTGRLDADIPQIGLGVIRKPFTVQEIAHSLDLLEDAVRARSRFSKGWAVLSSTRR